MDVDIPAKVSAALESELGTRLNYCRVVVNTAVDYILGGAVGIEADDPEAEAFLYDVYENSYLLGEEMLKLVTIMCKKGDAFLKLYIEDSQIKVKVLRPEIVFPRYKTDDYGEMLYCAIKWFEEDEENPRTKTGKAQVFYPDSIDYYELGESEETEFSQWELYKSEPNPLRFIPIIHVKNTVDDLEFGVSDLQVMTDLQDALNKTITDMLLCMDNQAFQRIVFWGAQSPKGKQLEMEPGTITEVPTTDGHLDVISASEISPFNAALKEIVHQIITVTSISKLYISEPEVSHPSSGYALKVRAIPLERKCGKKITILINRFKELNRMIFEAAKLLKLADYTGVKTKLHFTPGLPVDEITQMQVTEGRLRMKIKSRRAAMEEAGVEDTDAEMEQIRAEEQEDLDVAMAVREREAAIEAKFAPKPAAK